MSLPLSSIKAESQVVALSLVGNLFDKCHDEIKHTKISKKIAPTAVKDDTISVLHSFVLLSQKQTEMSDGMHIIPQRTTLNRDSLAVHQVKTKVRETKRVPEPLLKNHSQISNNISNLSKIRNKRTSKLQKNKSLSMKANSCHSSEIFQDSQKFHKLVLHEDNKSCEEIEKIKSRKFFIEESKEKEKQLLSWKLSQARQDYELKSSKLKKYGDGFSFDYDGDTFELKKKSLNQPIMVHQIVPKCGKVDQKGRHKGGASKALERWKNHNPVSDPTNFVNNIARIAGNQRIFKNQSLHRNMLNEQIGKGIDPLTQLNSDNLSEGIKISNTTNNLKKERVRQARIKTLHQFKNSGQIKPFKEYVRKINKITSKTEEITESPKKYGYEMGDRGESYKLFSQNISRISSKCRKSILDNLSENKSEKTGKIRIDNNGLYGEICLKQI